MITKELFKSLATLWLKSEKGRRKYQLAEKLGVSKQYVSRAFSSNDDEIVSGRHIQTLMELNDCAVILYPKGYFKIVQMKSTDQVMENQND